MRVQIDLPALLAPIPGEAPSGEDLRYTRWYDDIKEARRADDVLPQGQWQREIKSSDWKKVITLCLQALAEKSKDLQIAAWLGEALVLTEGFEGAEVALKVLHGLLDGFWESVFPLIEDDDYDYRCAPFEFLNDKMGLSLRQLPLTDPAATPGYSLLKWQEIRDPNRKEGEKISSEEFNAAVARTPAAFYQNLLEVLTRTLEDFRALDLQIDQRFGPHAPRFSQVGQVLEECLRLVAKIGRDEKGIVLAGDAAAPPQPETPQPEGEAAAAEGAPAQAVPHPLSVAAAPFPAGDDTAQEEACWREALALMQREGPMPALNWLLALASRQPSDRGRQRYNFLVAKLCLKAGKPDLARPILERLYALINELHLERWEASPWVAEVFEALHQCLCGAEASAEEKARAQEIFKTICTLDVTKAFGK